MEFPDILDFEASGFGSQSYPIEVGYSLADGERFCTLIRPIAEWDFWDPKAEQLHQISRHQLMTTGMDVGSVCRELNERLAGRTLYSDGWVVDRMWLDKLFYEARLQPKFRLSAIENIQSECQHMIWDRVRQRMLQESECKRHRASTDANFIQQVYQRTRNLCTG